jgi:hypothetical protein
MKKHLCIAQFQISERLFTLSYGQTTIDDDFTIRLPLRQ